MDRMSRFQSKVQKSWNIGFYIEISTFTEPINVRISFYRYIPLIFILSTSRKNINRHFLQWLLACHTKRYIHSFLYWFHIKNPCTWLLKWRHGTASLVGWLLWCPLKQFFNVLRSARRVTHFPALPSFQSHLEHDLGAMERDAKRS